MNIKRIYVFTFNRVVLYVIFIFIEMLSFIFVVAVLKILSGHRNFYLFMLGRKTSMALDPRQHTKIAPTDSLIKIKL